MVRTSVVPHTVTCGRRLVLLNRHAISARRGLIVSGAAGTGKTIAITQLGRSHELLDRARNPTATDRIPVIYITVPPAATPRMIAAEFARFLGLPVMARMNITDLIESVVGVCTDARTGMILVDELHNVSLTTRHGAERRHPEVLLRTHPRDVHLRGHRHRAQHPGDRNPGRPNRWPFHPDPHPPVPLQQ